MKLLLSIILCLGLSTLVWAETLPPRIEINYKIITPLGDGELNEVLEIFQDESSSRYSISSDARPIGMLELVVPGRIIRDSQGKITNIGLMPQRFTDQRNNHPPSIAQFDWENSILTMLHHDKKKQESLPAGTQDRLSLPYSFMFAPPLKQKKITMYETDGHTLIEADYTVNKEKLETPLGTLDTIVLTRQSKKDDNIERKIWLATRFQLLPVRIVAQEESGFDLEQMVTAIHYAKNPNVVIPDKLTENRQ